MKKLVLASVAALIAAPALAHTGHGDATGLAHGLAHPLMGADHLLAMLAVGLWSGFVLPRRLWAGAAAFLGAMVTGAGLAWGGAALPLVEPMIALSVLVFGVMTLLARRGQSARTTGASLAAIALFGLFHGFAHGAEATGTAGAYLAGFVLSTAALHLAGVVIARGMSDGRLARLVTGGGLVAGGLMLVLG